MALSQVEKIKIMGIISKSAITCLNDMLVETKEVATVDDYLDFMIFAFNKKIESKSKDKILLKCLTGIDLLLLEYIDQKYTLDESFKERILKIKETYFDYVVENNIEVNQDVVKKIGEIENDLIQHTVATACADVSTGSIDEIVVEASEETKEEAKEVLNEMLSKVSSLEIHNGELESTLKKTKTELSSYKRKYTTKEKEVERLNEAIKIANAKLDNATICGKESNIKIDKLQTEIEELKHQAEEAKLIIQSDVKTLKNLEREKEELSKSAVILDEMNRAKESNQILDNAVLSSLSKCAHSIDEIIKELSIENIYANKADVLNSIRRLNEIVSIDTFNMRDFKPIYRICSPTIKTEKTTSMEVSGDSCLDVLLISDLHIIQYSESLKKLYDSIYEYAINNNIRLILNLGDLFDFDYSLASIKGRDERIKKMHEMVVTTANNLPECKSINHGILGGNHDMNIVHKGIDPIELFVSNRNDSINLGYTLANLKIGNNSILLHHPSIRFKSFPDIENAGTADIFDYINKSANKLGINSNNVYMNAFGHFHKNCVDSNGLISVPSLTKDRVSRGAIHLKIYLDDKKNISNIVCVNVIKDDDKLIKSSEVMYKKRTLTK